MRHKHADAIIAWAEGKEIEWRCGGDNEWTPVTQPNWMNHYEYRIKPTPPKWYENIPEHGVLCWVRGMADDDGVLRIILYHNPSSQYPYCDNEFTTWAFAHPLSNQEIQQFIRSNNNDN